MGRELDSLADVISFGIAPAVMAYACGMQGLYERVIWFFSWPVAYRDWRATTSPRKRSQGTGKVEYFEGTPIPTSIVLARILTVAASRNAIGTNTGSVH